MQIGWPNRVHCRAHRKYNLSKTVKTTTVQEINGLDLNALGRTVAAIEAQPQVSQFKFRATNC